MYSDDSPGNKKLFRQFVNEMNVLLRATEGTDKRNNLQLIDDMVKLETKFRDTLLTTKAGVEIYKEFMRHIVEDNGNILTCQGFFRERQETFFESISKAFDAKKPHLLHRFRINFQFTSWVMKQYSGQKKTILNGLHKQISDVRNKVCQNNLPLAINRAKIFSNKTGERRVQYMDLIQDASEGLLIAIDKLVPEDSSLAGVAVGRMTSVMIDDVRDSTTITLSPKEKRILYRARNAEAKEHLTDEDAIVEYVQRSFKGVTKESLRALRLAAQEAVNLYNHDSSGISVIDTLPCNQSPEDDAVESDLNNQLKAAVENLPVLERKVVRLKNGV